ncbi:MAG TPA: hypothetical protein VF865_03470 [Acidobacteriaceae bacterium]
MTTIIIFGLVSSLLAVFCLGVLLIRKWVQSMAELRLWTEHQEKLLLKLKNAPPPVLEEDEEMWRNNRQAKLDD